MEVLENKLKILQNKRTLEYTIEYKEFKFRTDRIKLGLYTLMPKDRAKVQALVAYKLVLNEGDYDENSFLKRISAYAGIPMKMITHGGRGSILCALRLVTYHAYRCLGISFPKVGKIACGKNHSTVINGCNVINKDIARYKEFIDTAFQDRLPTGEEMYRAFRYDKE